MARKRKRKTIPEPTWNYRRPQMAKGIPKEESRAGGTVFMASSHTTEL